MPSPTLPNIDEHFREGVTIRGEAAGMHVTVRFRDAAAVRAAAERNGVHLAGTDRYYLGAPMSDEFILVFAAIGEYSIRKAVRRLAD